jgi:serine protease AprX
MARRFAPGASWARRHRRALVVALATTSLVAGLVGSASTSVAKTRPSTVSTIDPTLAALLTQVSPNDLVPVFAILRDQLDPGQVRPGRGETPSAAIVRALRGLADPSQRGVIEALRGFERAGRARSVTSLWIRNALSFAARPDVIRMIAARPEIGSVVPDATIAAPASEATVSGGSAEPNVALVGAADLWSLGFRGDGVTIAVLDTGVDNTHPDLAAQWRGGAGGWFDPYGQHSTPTDRNGHGTQAAGIAAGRSAGGTAIGVAPNATWIAAKIFNDSGTATSTAIHQSFQWVLDPDADPMTNDAPAVVNNSWTIGAPGCTLDFEPDLAALVAAGITPVFAAGNFGPATGSSPSPANNPDAFAAGATDVSDTVIASSSRGPTSCGRPAAATYPSLVAPGAAIRTSDLFGTYTSATGTSYAAPHVSGALALLRQAVPTASADELRAALRAAAKDLGTMGPDDSSGSGRLDLLAAYRLLTGGGPTPTPTPTPTSTPTPTATPSDTSGPLSGVPAIAPNPANGTSAVSIAATLSDATTGGSPIVAAEWFRGTAGAPGTGRQMSGAFGTSTVTVTGTIPASEIMTLPDGSQTIAVRGRDGAGNWGPISTASVVVDRTPPTAFGGTITPAQSQGASTAQIQTTLSDATSGVAGGEWFVGADPGQGMGTALQAADGAFGGSSETGIAAIPLAGRPLGELIVSYRARDAAGTWSAVSTVPSLVTPADGIFADGFETASLARWSSATGANRLAAVQAAAMAGRYGLSVMVSSGSGGYLTDASPASATAYHARFGFDSRSFPTAGKAIDVFTALTARNALALEVQYRRDASGISQLRVGAARAGSPAWTSWVTLASGPHTVEVGWQSVASATVNLWIDGQLQSALTGLDTRAYTLDAVRLGPSAGLAKTMSGELRFDRFVSSAGSLIGP